MWGSFGLGDGQFINPSGLTVDSEDNIYVDDFGENNRIQKFDGEGNLLTKWGTPGTRDGQFINPAGLASYSSNNIHMVDAGNDKDKAEKGKNWRDNLRAIVELAEAIRSIAAVAATIQGIMNSRRRVTAPAVTTSLRSNTIENDRLILEELSKTYDRNLDMRKDTEGKANKIITFSGVILVLLLGFITLSFERLEFRAGVDETVKVSTVLVILAIIGSLMSGFA